MNMEKDVKRLEFQLTKSELMEYCVKVAVKSIWMQKLEVAVFAMMFIASAGEGLLMAAMGNGMGDFMLSLFCVCLFAFAILAVTCVLLYWQCGRQGFLKPRAYRIEEGYLVSENDNVRIPCSRYTYQAGTFRVLILGRPEAEKNIVYLPFPKRIFPDREAMDSFLNLFKKPQAAKDQGHVVKGTFNFCFFMDQTAWSHLWTQELQAGLQMRKIYGSRGKSASAKERQSVLWSDWSGDTGCVYFRSGTWFVRYSQRKF